MSNNISKAEDKAKAVNTPAGKKTGKTDGKEKIKTSIGGQALIEGVMMLGPDKGCMAVRRPDKTIYTEEWKRKERKWYNKAPFVRGCVNFVAQLADGYKYINKSGEISGMFDDIEEDTKSGKKAADKAIEPPDNTDGTEAPDKAAEAETPEIPSQAPGRDETVPPDSTTDSGKTEKPDGDTEKKEESKIAAVVAVISGILGIGLAIVMLVVLPTLIFSGIQTLFGDTDISAWRSLVEGVLKIIIFILYLWLTSLMQTMKRLYKYHGAEHKTIFCYEHGKELTVENVRTFKRFHPRCGTSFIFLTLAISILVYSLLPINSEMFINNFNVSKLVGDLMRIGCKLLFLPVIVGVSYELIKLAGRYDNILTRIISAPGLAIQRLTTKEPDDEMIEIAIAAMRPVLPERPEDAKW